MRTDVDSGNHTRKSPVLKRNGLAVGHLHTEIVHSNYTIELVGVKHT